MDLPIPPELAVDRPPFEVERLSADVEPPRWRIESHGEAEWSLRHLAEAQAAVDAVAEQAAEWRRRVDEWEATATKPLRWRLEFFRHHLEDYALRVRDASCDEVKSIALPSGTVQTHAGQPRLVVRDAEAFAKWAEENPDDPVVRVKYELNAAAAKAAFVPAHEVVGYLHRLTLVCGATIEEQLEEPAPEWTLDAACPECAPAGMRDRCAIAEVETTEVVRHVVRDRNTGFPVEWAGVEPASVSAKVKL